MSVTTFNKRYIERLKYASARLVGMVFGDKLYDIKLTKIGTPHSLFDLARERIQGIAKKRKAVELMQEFASAYMDKTGNNIVFTLNFTSKHNGTKPDDAMKRSAYLLRWERILKTCITEAGWVYSLSNRKFVVSMKNSQNVEIYKMLQGSIPFDKKHKLPEQNDLERWEFLSGRANNNLVASQLIR